MTCLSEHPLDRLIRVHNETNRVIRWEFWGDSGFAWITGKTATKRWHFWENPVSLLVDHECQICKKRGNKKTIRSCFVYADPAGWDEKGNRPDHLDTLCLSCYMTLENARRKWWNYEQLRKQANTIKRKIYESTKNNA